MENRQVVVFKLMGHEFGIDIKKVREILNYEWVRPIPAAPDYIEGIINVRGVVYPIFNLRKRLNMSQSDKVEDSKFILLHIEEHRVGFLVDNVKEILTVETESVEKAPKVVDKNQTNCIEYIVKQKDAMVIVLNANEIISDADHLFIQGVSDEENCSSNAE